MDRVARLKNGAVVRSPVDAQLALADTLDFQSAVLGGYGELPPRKARSREGGTGLQDAGSLAKKPHAGLVGLPGTSAEYVRLSFRQHRDFPHAKRLFRRPREH